MEFPNKDTILEIASESSKSLQNLISVLTHQPSHSNSNVTNTTVANFNKLSSSLPSRTGHARFRRAPVVPLPQPLQTSFPSMPQPPLHIQPQHQSLTLDFTKPNIL
ncbi:WRKY transcription factor [Trifolium repens]|nr:putative WRKY transcription factor [Trifolium repens]WJX41917.1 WRKY transcription factor [Trifolium repens]